MRFIDSPTLVSPMAGIGNQALPPAYYANFLSNFAKEQKPSASTFLLTLIHLISHWWKLHLVRSLFPLEHTPGIISLLAGKPNPSTFPFNSLTFTAKSPLNPKEELRLTVEGDDLVQGLQYGDTAGFKPLIDWIGGLQEVNHGRKGNEGWRISIGSGSQDLMYKVRFK